MPRGESRARTRPGSHPGCYCTVESVKFVPNLVKEMEVELAYSYLIYYYFNQLEGDLKIS